MSKQSNEHLRTIEPLPLSDALAYLVQVYASLMPVEEQTELDNHQKYELRQLKGACYFLSNKWGLTPPAIFTTVKVLFLTTLHDALIASTRLPDDLPEES